MSTTRERYSATAKWLHWLMAFGLLGMLCLGFWMADLPLSPLKLKVYSWHKWAGVVLFALVWLRLAVRLAQGTPPLPAMPRWQQVAAHGAHHLLYTLMVVIPLSGWLMSSAKGFTTVLFGLWPLPDLLEKNAELGELLEVVHGGLNVLLALTIGGHVLAAFKHQFIDRDGLLWRMLPDFRRKS